MQGRDDGAGSQWAAVVAPLADEPPIPVAGRARPAGRLRERACAGRGAGRRTVRGAEPLIAARAGGEALTITVTSNGCTSKADFSVFVERKGRAVQVAFGRRKLDVCRAAPRPLELTFTWAELGLAAPQPVFLLNPLEGR